MTSALAALCIFITLLRKLHVSNLLNKKQHIYFFFQTNQEFIESVLFVCLYFSYNDLVCKCQPEKPPSKKEEKAR